MSPVKHSKTRHGGFGPFSFGIKLCLREALKRNWYLLGIIPENVKKITLCFIVGAPLSLNALCTKLIVAIKDVKAKKGKRPDTKLC